MKKTEQKSLQWNISDYKTWQYIVSDILTKHDGIGQYLDDGFCQKIAKYMQENWSKKLSLEQNPTWSEEDEMIVLSIEQVMNCASLLNIVPEKIDKIRTWLKSIRYRVGCETDFTTKKEWSEDDEKMCQETIDWFEKKCFPYALESENPARESIKWLKSLKDKYAGKPSDEQIKVCKEVYADLLSAKGFNVGTINSELNRLEEQLKKLKNKAMEAKEAPEKLYITYKGYGVFDEDSSVERTNDSQTEYTRTDAFIERALEWVRKEIRPYYSDVKYKYEDFKKYMEE